MPTRRSVRRSLLAGLAALLAAAGLLAVRPPTAAAVVTPLHGFRATVDGFTSWYGSYEMGPLGTSWCIDHGIRAPDPAFGYVAADLSAVPAETRVAMAWVLGAHGRGAERVAHAALMLVLHDLMGARYPSGPLRLDQLGPDRLAGFEGHELEVLRWARLLRADALAHRHLRGPLRLTLTVPPLEAGSTTVTVTLRDSAGRPVSGVDVGLEAPNGGLRAARGTTAPDGTWRTEARPQALPLSVRALATAPHLELDAWAPTVRPAQRVARPGTDDLSASITLAAPPTTTTTPATTTTTTAAPSTTTTVPATTTTAAPTTTTVPPTTVPPTTVPPTTAPPTTVPTTTTTSTTVTTTTPAPSTTTTLPPSTPTTALPPATTTTAPTTVATPNEVAVPSTTTTRPPPAPPSPSLSPPPGPPGTAPPPAPASLPRTGFDLAALGLAALGSLLVGSAALDTARSARRRAAIDHHGRHGGLRR